MRRKVTCPESGHLEELEVTEDPVDGHILGVTRCSRLSPADVVDCGQECAHLLNRRLANIIQRERSGPIAAQAPACGCDDPTAPPCGPCDAAAAKPEPG